jgi:hypothetical protein
MHIYGGPWKVDLEAIRALAAGTPPAPARVVTLDSACCAEGLEPTLALADAARSAGCRVTLRIGGSCEPRQCEALVSSLQQVCAARGQALRVAALACPGTAATPDGLLRGMAGLCDASPALYLLLPVAALEAIQRRRSVTLAHGDEVDGRQWWQALLAVAESDCGVSLVPEAPGPGVSRFAPGNSWSGPSPVVGELVPAHARRLRLSLDFGALVAAAGDHPIALGRLAGELVALADGWLDTEGAGTRRLALELGGIAGAVVARGHDPRSFSALRWVKSRLGAFRDGACAASVRLARVHGAGGGLAPFPLPGRLEVSEAGPRERAVLAYGARHSHLVSISPWSLAPPEFGRDAFGLLPALACADSVCWRRPAAEHGIEWYGEALRFAWAVALRG